jgi:PIN domain nuclease of toxin-antitoxin system
LPAASVREIAIKQALGKLTEPPGLLHVVVSCGLVELPIRSRRAIEAESLPPLHRDPFDRMLVAQARCEGLTVLSGDPQAQRYDVLVNAVWPCADGGHSRPAEIQFIEVKLRFLPP